MKNIVVFGATSMIAQEVSKKLICDDSNVYLFARNNESIERVEQDLLSRGVGNIYVNYFEALDFNSHDKYINDVFSTLGTVDVFLIAYGSLSDQEKCQGDARLAINEININGLSVVSLLTNVANRMENQGFGNITVITSVAGDRGRQSNYVYGCAKGMVSIFLEGLSQRLRKSDVHVLDIKPGFVETPMTMGFKKNFLWSKPEFVAKIIVNRIRKKKNFSYVPLYWWLIMTVIKRIPKVIFNKLKL